MLGQSDSKRILAAVHRSQAIIEFDLSGKILSANENFCSAMGYTASEIVGQHHSMFVEPDYAASQEYQDFWASLARGEFDAREYKRVAKGGREVWIQASYNPVMGIGGKPSKVIKFATDITDAKLKAADDEGKIEAISRSQAMIEFDTEGNILTANENFCDALGYQLSEIRGKHHRLFVDRDYANSVEYREFWEKLRGGEYNAAEFKRFGKGGKEIWIQASYNPILDMNGAVMKVVKFATDITERVRAVDEIGNGLKKLANGDLVQRIEKAFIPSLDSLRTDFNSSMDELQKALLQVGENAGSIQSGSDEIRASSDELSKRTEQQAASVEETAAAVEQITATVKSTATRAEEASDLVNKTKTGAEHSGEVVQNAVAAMGAIKASSDQIANIIGVIDDIAFQTNLLALNAGVEAARAGDAGRGFAVVAQEVRELAQRSAKAAQEIKQLITKSGEQVKSGVTLVDETGKSLEKIVKEVQEINEHVSAIVDTAREQSSGLEEVNQAVASIDQGTQQNATMVEESTAVSHNLAGDSTALIKLLSQFSLGQAGGAAKHPAAANSPSVAPVSPVKEMHNKVSAAFGPKSNAAVNQDNWDEF